MIFLQEKNRHYIWRIDGSCVYPKIVAASHIDFILAHLHYTYYNSILVSRVCGGISPLCDRISTLWRL